MVSWTERLDAGVIYLALSAFAHLVWEIVQLPFYTIWTSGMRGEIAFAVLHCTAGDILISACSLATAMVVGSGWSWPNSGWGRLTGLTILAGLAYTVYSEWHNVYVLQAWSYSPAMPIVHLLAFDIGVSPLLQWIVVPCVVFTILKRRWHREQLDRVG